MGRAPQRWGYWPLHRYRVSGRGVLRRTGGSSAGRPPRSAMHLRPSRIRLGTAALVAATVAVATVTATTPAQAAAAGCRVAYTVSSQWGGGFGANVAVTNLGDPLTSWTVRWSFTAGQTVTQAWNATVTQSGAAVTAVNM